jgi:hypothetical protein
MSWLGRLFGRAPAPPPVPPNTVVVPDDIAATLTLDGTALEDAVEASLRDYFDLRQRARAAAEAGERIPFWLQRETGHVAGIEDELLDRMAQRRSAEEDDARRGSPKGSARSTD